MRPHRSSRDNATGSRASLTLSLALTLALSACSDTNKRKLGASCDSGDECASGLCYQQLCLDPDADPDTDGLVNRLESALGTDPNNPDTDGDGVPDKDEVDAAFKPVDTDGDGTPDCLESRLADADQDCLDDEHDADALPSAPASLVAATCPTPRGACAAEGASLTVACKAGLDQPTCVYAGVPTYQGTETTCDAIDNDCDGDTDEGCSTPIGTQENPATSCQQIHEATPSAQDGSYWLDLDGEGPKPAFQVACDLSRDGGGWTLAYAYTFTAPTPFNDAANAVTPIPTWRSSEAQVPTSTTPPTLTTTGAIDYALWPALGREVLFDADGLDLVACQPGRGSLVDGTSGWIDCRVVEVRTTDCPGTYPNWLGWHPSGPMFANPDLWLFLDSSATYNWPTHDPCAQNRPPTTAPTGGRIWLRPTPREVERPRTCDEVELFDRGLPAILDPDGPDGTPPAPGQCAFGLERGDWTLMTPPVRAAMATQQDATWEYLLERNGLFYRSPTTSEVWDWTTPFAAPGLWVFHAPVKDGAFDCPDQPTNLSTSGLSGAAANLAAPRWGIGCAAPPDHVLPGAGPAPKKDPEAATTTTCQLAPNALSTNASDGCQDDVKVWMRKNPCPTDPDSQLGDGALSVRAVASPGQETCWNLWGDEGGFAFDEDDFPPGGSAPSLAVTNDLVGNDIWAYILNQQRLTFVAGRSYRLGFWAKAAEPRPIRVFVQTRELDHAYYWEDLALDPSWHYFELAFDADVTSWDAMLDFQLADFSTATVWLDEVTLSDTGPTPCARIAPELIADPDLSAGRTCWRFGLSSDTTLARASAEDGALRLEKSSGPADDWSAVLYQRGLVIAPDRHYRLTLTGRAAAPRDLYAAITDFEGGLGVLGGGRVAFGTTQSTQVLDFVTTQGSATATLHLAFGNSDVTLWLGTISLVDLGPNPCLATPPDLIGDPGFDAGTACWSAQSNGGVNGRYSLDADHPEATRAPSLKVENLVPDNQLWDTALFQRGFHVDAGQRYTLRFWAKAAAPRTLVALVHNWDTNTMFVYCVVNLTTNWQEFVVDFTAPTTEDNVLLELQFGQVSTAAVWLDDVRLLEGAPVAHWTFDEGDGLIAHDVIGPHDGTVHGATWVANCIHGGCLRFAGADWVDAPATQIPWGAAPRTLSLFFKSEKDLLASTESALCQWGTASNTNMFGLITSQNNPGRLYFFGYNADLSGGPAITQDTWHHGAVTYDPQDNFVRLYLDGQPVAAQAIALGTTIDSHGVTIGWRPDGGYWTGLIDDVRIYDRALEASEVQALSGFAAP